MNINGYTPLLIYTLGTIARWDNMLTISDGDGYSVEATWRGCWGNPAFTSLSRPSSSLIGTGKPASMLSAQKPAFLEPQKAVPRHGSNPLRRGWVYRLALEVPLFKGIPMEAEAFLEQRDVSGLQPYAQTYLKKTLCHTYPFGGVREKYSNMPTK